MARRAACAAALAAVVLAHPGAPAAGAADEPGGSPSAPPSVFGFPDPAADFETLSDFRLGRAVFRQFWTPAGEGPAHFDGLGPLYNARSCESCHVGDGRGRPPGDGAGGGDALTMIVKLAWPDRDAARAMVPDPVYGAQLQDRAIAGHAAEGRVAVTWTGETFAFADGERAHLRRPDFTIAAPAYGRIAPGLVVSARIAPPLVGLGLVQRIAEADIIAGADPDDRDGDGISGRAAIVTSEHGALALGRFGWKASQPTVAGQIAAALSADMGVSSEPRPAGHGDCTPSQRRCRAAPDGNSAEFENLEAPPAILKWLVRYTENLAVPPRQDPADAGVGQGEAIFAAIGCGACHRPEFSTRPDPDQPHLGGRRVAPYSDFLLHDMGEGLDDGFAEAGAAAGEWRTAPLWAIGLTGEVNGNLAFLHDGRARSLTEAIVWHGGEARAARDAFAGLARADRGRLLSFLGSL
jgi:CxxC motif-containing protein (DUF1111 family)